MRNLIFSTLFFAITGCHQQDTSSASQHTGVNDTVLNVPDDMQDTSKSDVEEGPSEEEIAAYDARQKLLENKTEDSSYREKAIKSRQYIFNEDDDLAIRWATDSINHISCAIYITGGTIPIDDANAKAPGNLNELIKKIADKHLMLLVNGRQIDIKKDAIAPENIERMEPMALGTFEFKGKPYLLVKCYASSMISSGSGNNNLLVDVNDGRVWTMDTYGEVLFKQLIDSITYSH